MNTILEDPLFKQKTITPDRNKLQHTNPSHEVPTSRNVHYLGAVAVAPSWRGRSPHCPTPSLPHTRRRTHL